MHTSGPGAAPSLPHRYTSVPLPHSALPSAPSHAFPFNIPLLRLHKKEEVEEKAHKDSTCARNLQTEALSQPWSPTSRRGSPRVLERKSRIPLSPRPARSRRAGGTPQRRERAAETEERECRGTPKERRSRDGGD